MNSSYSEYNEDERINELKPEDRDILLNFIYDNSNNPKHQMILSTEAKLRLKIIEKNHIQKFSTTISEFCGEIYNHISQETSVNELINWYGIVINLYKANVNKSDELETFVLKNIPKNMQYKIHIKKIKEHELFDEFIHDFLCFKTEISLLNEFLQAWCMNMTDQLHKHIVNAIDLENREKLKQESDKKFKKIYETPETDYLNEIKILQSKIESFEQKKCEKEERILGQIQGSLNRETDLKQQLQVSNDESSNNDYGFCLLI